MGALIFVGIFIGIGYWGYYILGEISNRKKRHDTYKNGGALASGYVLKQALDVKASSAYAASIAEAKLLFMVNSDYSNEYELKNGFSIYSEHGDREKEYLNTIPSVSSVSEIDRRAKANGYYFDRNLNYRDLENKDKIDHNLYKSKIAQLEAKDREIKTYA